MVRVGRILLVLLFVATLLSSNQISPKAETAQAQSQQDLVVGFNNLQVVVQKDDNSVAQYPQTGNLDYRSYRVFFNGITVTNPTSQTVYIRARAQLSTANGWSLCIRDCGFTSPPLRINAGQTITLPDNTVDFVTGNLHTAMVAEMALNGVNSMKLQITVMDNYGTLRADTSKDNVLRWTSVRIKLTQGGQPLSNTSVNFIRQGSSWGDPGNTGGTTNGNGQAGMGLIYPPNATYTVKTGSFPGTPLRDIEITGYEFIDVTATTDGRPDFVMDLSNARVFVNNSPVTPAHLYIQMGVFEIRNVVIKNIGEVAAPPGAVVVVMAPNEAQFNSLPDFEPLEFFETLITNDIAAGGQLTLPPIRVDVNNEDKQEKLVEFTTLLTKEGSTNEAALVAGVNYDYDNYEPVEEISNENNLAITDSFFDWQAFEITVTAEKDGQSSPLPSANLDVMVEGVYQFEADQTDESGKSYLAMRANSIPKARYTIVADIGSAFSEKMTKEVTSFTYERIEIEIDLTDGLILLTEPMLLDKNDLTKYVLWDEGTSTSGEAQITADNGQTYAAPVLFNRAIFRGVPPTVKRVTVDKISNSISFNLASLQDTINYSWDSTTNGPLSFANNGSVNTVEMKLIRECNTQLTPNIKACFYEEPTKIEEFKKSVLPVYARSLKKMTDSFDPSVRLTSVKEVWLVSYYSGGGTIGVISERPPTFRLWTMPRYTKGDKLDLADLVTHEAMHALDAQIDGNGGMFSANNPFYNKSVTITGGGNSSTWTEATGLWAWKNLQTTCSIIPEPSRSRCLSHDDPRDGPAEVFAEQATNICLFPKETISTLNNYANIYAANPMRSSSGNALPPPVDLLPHRDVIASRSVRIGNSTFGNGQVIYDSNSSGYITGYSYILQTIMSSCARSE